MENNGWGSCDGLQEVPEGAGPARQLAEETSTPGPHTETEIYALFYSGDAEVIVQQLYEHSDV